MKFESKYFGEIEFEEENIIVFHNGLVGFEDKTKFIVIYNPNPELPFHWLQSLDDSALTFVVCSPFAFTDKYEFDIPEMDEKELELSNPEDVLIYAITVIPDVMEETSINLKAPIVINTRTKIGKQLVLDTDKYPIKFKIFSN